MERSARVLILCAGAAALVLALAGCGGDDEPDAAPTTTAPAETGTQDAAPEPQGPPEATHVHALGVDPADGSLVIATHSGLWRLAEGETEAQFVGENRQDVMGFLVVGPGSYLGSGHPDPVQAEAENLPPLLGLIASEDAGLTWTPVSLSGFADFHLLRASGETLYGFDITSGLLRGSTDGGETWEDLDTPGLVLDIAIDPDDPKRLLASGERGITESFDGGASWEPLSNTIGFLAWVPGQGVFLVDGVGDVSLSESGAREDDWRVVGNIGAQPAAFLADGDRLYAALHDNTIVLSEDGGATWSVLTTL